ncbi:YopX family protein [Brevibacillus panacihumi]|uniref:YopX family protein n=1 Tax=Brevibacillus panacihumi TaxID=497735 RepID=UPI003D1DD070
MQAGREPKYRAFVHSIKWLVDVAMIDFFDKEVELDMSGTGDTAYYRFDEIDLMQFTGLCDKNGKEIFEEDILETRDDDGSFYLKVIYDEEYARYWFVDEADNGYCYAPDEFDRDEILVIGNIYENPELLEVGN